MAGFRIEKRKIASGELRYKCIVREKSEGKIIHNESKTFSTKALADTWGKKRVYELQTRRVTEKKSVVTLLNLYYENHDLWNNTGRTKRYVLKMLMDCDIATIRSNELKVNDLIEHCTNRRDAGATSYQQL